jgi:hypothetical protein
LFQNNLFNLDVKGYGCHQKIIPCIEMPTYGQRDCVSRKY